VCVPSKGKINTKNKRTKPLRIKKLIKLYSQKVYTFRKRILVQLCLTSAVKASKAIANYMLSFQVIPRQHSNCKHTTTL